jgi:Domain of Unknown Function (DUF1520).
MLKIVTAGVTALFVTASTLAFAQAPSAGVRERLGAAGQDTLTSTQINVVKAALHLTPDQEKYWPAIENAMRVSAEHRQARIANVARAMVEKGTVGPMEALRDHDPIDFLHQRADALSQRGADLKALADAWQPLYQTLKPDQKRRMAFLTISVLRVMGNRVEQRRWQSEEDAEE